MSLFTCLLAVLYVASLVHGLDATQCVDESAALQPTTILAALLSNKEHTGMYAGLDISRRSPPSNSTDDAEEGMIGSLVDPGSGSLNRRQGMCLDPRRVPICPGPLPCCVPTYTVCCPGSVCCQTGTTCGPSGTILCCVPGSSVCGNRCCRNCCSGVCCLSGEVCDNVRGRCYDPVASSLSIVASITSVSARSASLASLSSASLASQSSAAARSASLAASPTPSPNSPSDEGPELEVTLEPSDSQIQYDPSDAWSSSGGVCTNGTRSTTQIGAKFTLKFRGTEISVSFVPKQENITVSAELNGAPLGEFDIPGQSQSRCQLQNSWNKALPASANEHQLTFTYTGYASPSTRGRRAPPALELGQIRYRKTASSPSSQTSQSVQPNAAFHLVIAASVLVMLLTLFG